MATKRKRKLFIYINWSWTINGKVSNLNSFVPSATNTGIICQHLDNVSLKAYASLEHITCCISSLHFEL